MSVQGAVPASLRDQPDRPKTPGRWRLPPATVLALRSPRLGGRLFLYAVLLVFMVWPALMLLVASFRDVPPGFSGEWTATAWQTTFTGPGVPDAIWNTVVISLITTAAATFIAGALAFLSERTDLPGRRLILPGALLAFATPSLFYGLGYSFLGNKYTGWLNSVAHWAVGTDYLIDIETWTGLIVASLLKKAAVIYLFLLGPVRALSGLHDDASLVSGASQVRTFFSISLPSLMPAFSGAVLLGLVAGLQIFDLVLILGWPQSIDVIATRVLSFITGMAGPDYAKACVLSVMLVAVVGVLCIIQARLLARRSFVTISGKQMASRPIRLGRARLPLMATVWVYLILAVLFPIGSVVFTSFQPIPGVYGHFSWQHYQAIFALPRVTSAIALTFAISIGAGFVAMLLALSIAQITKGLPGREAAWVRFVTYIPLAMPGAVTAVAISSAVISTPVLKQLYGTSTLMTLALVICVVPFAIQVANAAVGQVSNDLQEAAWISGASRLRTFIDVTLRILAPSFLAGWFMAAVLVSGNLEVPLLLKAPDLNLMATVVYNLYSTSDHSAASALLVTLLLAEFGLLGIAYLLWRLLSRAWDQRGRLLSAIVVTT